MKTLKLLLALMCIGANLFSQPPADTTLLKKSIGSHIDKKFIFHEVQNETVKPGISKLISRIQLNSPTDQASLTLNACSSSDIKFDWSWNDPGGSYTRQVRKLKGPSEIELVTETSKYPFDAKKVFEVKIGKIDDVQSIPENILNDNALIFSKKIDNVQFVLLSSSQFEIGKNYVWKVDMYISDQLKEHSDIFSFYIQPTPPPVQVLPFFQAPPGACECPGYISSSPSVFDNLSCFMSAQNTEIWSISKPDVTKQDIGYPGIKFRKGDLIQISAGGCVQTGGTGLTWKRYVEPMKGGLQEIDDKYFGSVYIPGILESEKLANAMRNAPIKVVSEVGNESYLHLQYSDDGFGDNSYNDHDNGWWEQCREMEDAWVIVIIKHDCSESSDLQCALPAPLDLVSTRSDANGLPLNPQWGWQATTKTKVPEKEILNFSFKSVGMPEDGVELGTHQATHKNNNPTKCPQAGITGPYGTYGRIGGHVNWQNAIFHGNIFWESHSDPAKDDDYSLQLKMENEEGYTSSNGEGIGVEFSSDEVIDRAKSKWWKNLRTVVDQNLGSTSLGINGQEAFVIGMVGLDCAHSCFTELHPAFLMAVHVKKDIDDDVWAIFVRNRGDEGYCGGYGQKEDLNLPNNVVALCLPSPENGLWQINDIPFGLGLSELQYSHDGMNFSFKQDTKHTLLFTLKAPAEESLIEGELHIKWKKIMMDKKNIAKYDDLKKNH